MVRGDMLQGRAARAEPSSAAVADDENTPVPAGRSALRRREPGRRRRLPLRSAEIAVPGSTKDPARYLRSVLAALRAPRLPLLAARTRVTGAGAAALLQIGFLAPTPLGLLRMRAPA